MATIEAPGEKIAVGDLVYEADGRFTEFVDYGVAFEDWVSGEPLPAAGHRFDMTWEGTVTGLLEGTLSGVEYSYTRADGRMALHFHGCLTTKDGARISVLATGTSIDDEQGLTRLFQHIELHSNFEAYQWVNDLPVRGEATLDATTAVGKIRATVA